MKNKKIELVFSDLQRMGKPIYQTEEGVKLTMGDFHSGTVFTGSIDLDEDNEIDLERIFEAGANPVFAIFPITKEK